jgi:hypothetical protein
MVIYEHQIEGKHTMPQPQKSAAARVHDLQVFHGIVHNVANYPAYTDRLPARERRQLIDTPLKKDFSPPEQAYLRAHTARRDSYADTHKAADEAVRAALPRYPDNEAERLWSSQQTWASEHSKALAKEVTTPRFADHLRGQVMQRTGQWLGPEAEGFLTRESQPHLYARVGAVALRNEFKGKSFHLFDADAVLESSLDRSEASAVRDLLINDGLLAGYDHTLQVNPQAVEHLSRQEIYTPPHNIIVPRF